MKKHYRSWRGELGSGLYRIIYLLVLGLGFKFLGTSVFDDIVLLVAGVITFELVGFILRAIGVWRY